MNKFFTYLLFFSLNTVWAQEFINDVGSRFSVSVKKKLNKGFSITGKVQARLEENVTLLNRVYVKVGLGYEVTDFLNLGLSANLMNSRSGYKPMEDEYRYAAFLTYKTKITEQLSFSDKLIYQVTNNYLLNSDLLDTESNTVVRNRVTLKYKLNRRGEIYATDELLFQLLGKKEKYLGRNRIYLGYIYKINNRLDLEPYFIAERSYNKRNGPQSRNFYYCLHLSINL